MSSFAHPIAQPDSYFFNRAIWARSIRESIALLTGLCLLMFAFAWVYVWLISRIELPALLQLLTSALKDFEKLSGVPFGEVATPEGRIALAFIDPLVHLTVIVWAISRGSDSVSGELERGTMEMLLAQPVGRLSIFASKSLVAAGGLVLICMALWCGISVGIALIVKETDDVWPTMYVPPTLNVLGLGFAVAGIATFVSSLDRYRWRTVGIMGAFYAVAVVLKVIGRMAPAWEPVGYASVFWAFEPQRMLTNNPHAWKLLLAYSIPLVSVGLVAFIAGAVVFCRRDLPAPL